MRIWGFLVLHWNLGCWLCGIFAFDASFHRVKNNLSTKCLAITKDIVTKQTNLRKRISLSTRNRIFRPSKTLRIHIQEGGGEVERFLNGISKTGTQLTMSKINREMCLFSENSFTFVEIFTATRMPGGLIALQFAVVSMTPKTKNKTIFLTILIIKNIPSSTKMIPSTTMGNGCGQ
jgi:hypothetical protein